MYVPGPSWWDSKRWTPQEVSVISLQTFQRRHFLQGELQGKELLGQARGQQTGRGQSLLTSPLLQEKAKPVGPGKGWEEQVKATNTAWPCGLEVCSQQRAPSPLPEVSEQLGTYCLSGTTSQRGGQSPA